MDVVFFDSGESRILLWHFIQRSGHLVDLLLDLKRNQELSGDRNQTEVVSN
jgi:hypothetical protein